MDEHFRMMARYNRVANERVYASCALLDDYEYRKRREGSFGSIHGLLNHMVLGDRIWMSRFAGGGEVTPPLDTEVAGGFEMLREIRVEEDARIEQFFAKLPAGFWERGFRYRNSRGVDYEDPAGMALSHFFNHQTHHRGQIHVMLSQTPASPP